MSSTLYWKPVTPNKDMDLGTGLKLLLRELYGFPVSRALTDTDIPTLRALKVGRENEVMSDIEQLITAIEKHGMIRLYEGNW